MAAKTLLPLEQLFTAKFGPEGPSLAAVYELATLKIESDFRPNLTSSSGARTPYQILPSTEKKLQVAYNLAPIVLEPSSAQWITGRNYFIAHTNEDLSILKTKGVPPLVAQMFPGASPNALGLLSLRYYYHNGPSLTVVKSAVKELPAALSRMATFLDYYSREIIKPLLEESKTTDLVEELNLKIPQVTQI